MRKNDETSGLSIIFQSNFRKTSGNIRKKATKSGLLVTKRDGESQKLIYSKSVCAKAHMGSNVKKTKWDSNPRGFRRKVKAPVERLQPKSRRTAFEQPAYKVRKRDEKEAPK